MKRIRSAEHPLGHDHHLKVALHENTHHRGAADGNGNGRIQRKKDQQGYDQGLGRHLLRSLISTRTATKACSKSTIPLMGKTSMMVHLGSWRAGEIWKRTK